VSRGLAMRFKYENGLMLFVWVSAGVFFLGLTGLAYTSDGGDR
jgi:hypothetical protein